MIKALKRTIPDRFRGSTSKELETYYKYADNLLDCYSFEEIIGDKFKESLLNNSITPKSDFKCNEVSFELLGYLQEQIKNTFICDSNRPTANPQDKLSYSKNDEITRGLGSIRVLRGKFNEENITVIRVATSKIDFDVMNDCEYHLQEICRMSEGNYTLVILKDVDETLKSYIDREIGSVSFLRLKNLAKSLCFAVAKRITHYRLNYRLLSLSTVFLKNEKIKLCDLGR